MTAIAPAKAALDADARILIQIGLALSAEHNHARLLERILTAAKEFCGADGGTLYVRDGETLRFATMLNDSLAIAMGGTTGKEIPFPPLQLYGADGQANHRQLASYAALTGRTVNIPDCYDGGHFDFSGPKAFDAKTGYRSRSFLVVPLKNHLGEVTGVLQLINRLDAGGHPEPFPGAIEPMVEALASQAAVALDNQCLIQAQKDLLEAFIKVIALAIDAKSPYTGGHCQRVPEITNMLAEAACADQGRFKDFDLDEDGWFELKIAGWLHDCGKVTTPEHVVDKATKLETIHDRVHEVQTRFAVLKQANEAAFWRGVAEGGDRGTLGADRDRQAAQLDDDCAFLTAINAGGEFMAPDKLARLHAIAAATTWVDAGGRTQPILTADEVRNLAVVKGTLTAEERKIINDHIVVTIEMLERLPFPKNLARVPEYAAGHHEKMDGTGYPKGLKRDQMSLPARMMAIADIFEALTAADRPYKKAMSLSTAIRIMADMKKGHHIDPDLFDLFLQSGVYRRYGEKWLKPEQVDAVDVAAYVG